MINKNVLQIRLLILLFLVSIIFYQIYFSDNEKIVQKKDLAIVNEVKKNEADVSGETVSNTIENLKYVSKDLLGNTYIVIAQSATIKKNNENQVKLNEVDAKIINKEKKTLFKKPY